MKEIIIHIGYPKTGTSYLQQNIFPAISQYDDINYISSNKIEAALQEITCKNEIFFNSTMHLSYIEPFLTKKVNIISYESLIGNVFYKAVNFTTVAKNLKKIFPSAKIIITLRNQTDMIYSLYSQYIHEGGTKKFKTFVNSFNDRMAPPELDDNVLCKEILNYHLIVDYYEALFGKSNIGLFFYEDLKSDPNTFTNKLVKFINCNKIELPSIEDNSTRINKSYSKTQLNIARNLNKLFYSHFNRNSFAINLKLPFTDKRINVFFLRRILQSKLSFIFFGSKKLTDKEFNEKILSYYKESNHTLRRKYGDKIPAEYK